jgi:hypothetical protein
LDSSSIANLSHISNPTWPQWTNTISLFGHLTALKLMKDILLLFAVFHLLVLSSRDGDCQSSQEYSRAPLTLYDDDIVLTPSDCRPADQDPGGHWGPVVNGFQLSIRAETNVVFEGGPIVVDAIFRNVTTNTMKRIAGQAGMINNVQVHFTIENEAQEVARGIADLIHPAHFVFGDFPGGTEVKSRYDLANYPLSPPRVFGKAGIYKIHVEEVAFEQMPTNRNQSIQVVSGTFELKILPRPSISTNGMEKAIQDGKSGD